MESAKKCLVFRENYEQGESVVALSCFHQFHAYRASKWFASAEKPACIVCKTTHNNGEVHLWPQRVVEEDKEAGELPTAAAADQEQRQIPCLSPRRCSREL